MQNLDVISVNIWQILISLINLVLLFLIIKKFLYKPVKKVLKERQDQLSRQYSAAEEAESAAKASRKQWEEKLSGAEKQADEMIQDAAENARRRSEKIVGDAKNQSERILLQARQDAELERRKAVEDIRREIVEVSGALSEKVLEREINEDDHRDLIDSFIEKIGEDDE